jgi:hypothetical protein
MRRVLFIITLLILVLATVAACSPEGAPTEESVAVDPTPTLVRGDLTWEQSLLVARLSETRGVPVEEITVVSMEAMDWPDGCLGVQKLGVMCTQAIVPGYIFILEAEGKQYEFHTNREMTVILPVEEPLVDTGPVEDTVIKQLAANLSLKESDISVVSSRTVEFGDTCLGVALEGRVCAQATTAGLIIVLEANGIQYEYHTSEDGSRVQPATIALVWKREGGIAGFCDTLTVFRSGEAFTSNCKSQVEGGMGTFADLLTTKEKQQFGEWMADFGEMKLDASDPKGVSDRMIVTLEFFGNGSGDAIESDQQALFEFAQNLNQKLVP